jgi:hypothetical protein
MWLSATGNSQTVVYFCEKCICKISTKLIGESMFCMKTHQLSIVLPSKSRLVQLRIHTSYTKTYFFLGVRCYFSRMTYCWSFVGTMVLYFLPWRYFCKCKEIDISKYWRHCSIVLHIKSTVWNLERISC